ncbi:hypothetical protein T492DRAFT_908730 [Pavlovales sp. CCMP2436]|nr:hypothetical protein T492DRAFT_908730 [Pavlovales sp. CCMP2436]
MRGFDHGPRTYGLHDETTDAIAVGLATQPGAVHAYVLGRCRGLAAGRVPDAFARAWGEAAALDRSALSTPSALSFDAASFHRAPALRPEPCTRTRRLQRFVFGFLIIHHFYQLPTSA